MTPIEALGLLLHVAKGNTNWDNWGSVVDAERVLRDVLVGRTPLPVGVNTVHQDYYGSDWRLSETPINGICGDCGSSLEAVRPGKYKCPKCG
ncbi:MAG: hypothetical protein HYY29_03610 [Chloroflexi bacterium]|nr:hypothetical protein [Chloroflexota bacterium]